MSLPLQGDTFNRYCRSHGYSDPIIFLEVESGSPERIEKRDELHRLIALAEPGDLIITPVVDRWSRDIVFGVGSVRALIKRGIGWRAIDEGIGIGMRVWLRDGVSVERADRSASFSHTLACLIELREALSRELS